MSFASAKVMNNLVSMQIVVVSDKFLGRVIKLVKMFPLKVLKINLNKVLETVIFGVYGCVSVEFMYCILVENIMVSCVKVYAVVKEDF